MDPSAPLSLRVLVRVLDLIFWPYERMCDLLLGRDEEPEPDVCLRCPVCEGPIGDDEVHRHGELEVETAEFGVFVAVVERDDR